MAIEPTPTEQPVPWRDWLSLSSPPRDLQVRPKAAETVSRIISNARGPSLCEHIVDEGHARMIKLTVSATGPTSPKQSPIGRD